MYVLIAFSQKNFQSTGVSAFYSSNLYIFIFFSTYRLLNSAHNFYKKNNIIIREKKVSRLLSRYIAWFISHKKSWQRFCIHYGSFVYVYMFLIVTKKHTFFVQTFICKKTVFSSTQMVTVFNNFFSSTIVPCKHFCIIRQKIYYFVDLSKSIFCTYFFHYFHLKDCFII